VAAKVQVKYPVGVAYEGAQLWHPTMVLTAAAVVAGEVLANAETELAPMYNELPEVTVDPTLPAGVYPTAHKIPTVV